ncbi:uncharacterized protein LOC141695397 [Apium graveolens]|uniref:uncharacterized protein LOC141695397 n=1 Tax=Apium graveolens TaxID=4045 RepID=UPI003D78B429
MKEYWVLHFDGASKTISSGAGLILQSPKRSMIEYALKLDFPTTNNEAEYKALIAGLGLARALTAKNLMICGELKTYSCSKHVPGEENTTSNALSKFASSKIENYPRRIYFQVLKTPTIHVINLIPPIGVASYWLDPIKTHLETGWLPNDAQEAHKLAVRALRYSLIEGLLYKRFFVIPYLKYLRPLEAYEMPNPRSDSTHPPERLTSISTPIPFVIWGMDVLCPLPVASGHRKFTVVAIDYFTKWIEAKALAKITTKQITQFFWENVICRFGIPRILVIDNERQFNNAEFIEYCDDNTIELRFTSVGHPQANGHAKVANRIILDGVKKRDERSRNTWVDELLPILWTYRTTCKMTTEATPLMLAYGAKDVVPIKITHGSSRVKAYGPQTN